MRHATASTLAALELKDRSGIFADVKLSGSEFTRVRATTPQEQERLLALVAESLAFQRKSQPSRVASP
jgi:hypothetical protein